MSASDHLQRAPVPEPGGDRQPAADSLASPPTTPISDRFTLDALSGRLVELTATGSSALLTAATTLVLEAQQRGEPAAWVGAGASVVYPFDLEASGVDLAALPIVRVTGAIRAARATDELLRSGGFALVIIDLSEDRPAAGAMAARRSRERRVSLGVAPRSDASPVSTRHGARGGPAIPLPIQTRLVGLANKHRAALVCLTRKTDAAPSLGSLVSLRARSDVMRESFGRFVWTLDVVKDKRCGPGWSYEASCRGPDGLV